MHAELEHFLTLKKKTEKNWSICLFFCFFFCFNPYVYQARQWRLFSGYLSAMFSILIRVMGFNRGYFPSLYQVISLQTNSRKSFELPLKQLVVGILSHFLNRIRLKRMISCPRFVIDLSVASTF